MRDSTIRDAIDAMHFRQALDAVVHAQDKYFIAHDTWGVSDGRTEKAFRKMRNECDAARLLLRTTAEEEGHV
jgi:hypothetical protein